MKKYFFLLITLFFVVSCGGGGGGGDAAAPTPTTITPPAQSLIGTYNLSSFEIYYDNGATIKSTDVIVKSYSGTTKLRSDLTGTQTVEINGTTASDTGTWEFNAATQKIKTTSPGGVVKYADVTFSGSVFTTNFYSSTYGGYREYDHWTKVSDIAAAAASTSKIASDAETTTEIVAIPESLNGAPDYQFGAFAGQLIEVAK